MRPLYFLKLGGSLITDKNRAHTHRPEALAGLAEQIAAALRGRPELGLVLGHGSGSFGHVAGKKYATRQGVSGPAQWRGFVEVWKEARALNQIVLEALLAAGLPVVAFPPSACAASQAGRITSWNLAPIEAALDAGLVPLVNGDVAFDRRLGGTILSTEDVFFYLAPRLNPQRILLAGIEAGVWEDYPQNTRLIPTITPASLAQSAMALRGSAAVDVTGGMLNKVESMLALVQEIPGLEVLIFSGVQEGNLFNALGGGSPGTLIHA